MGKEVPDMSAILKELDDRFAIDEMITATDLQETSVGKLQERIAASHKLLLTHYNKPFGVLIEAEVFSALVRRLRELEAMTEEEAASRFVDARLAKGIPTDDWLTQEQFNEAATRILGEPSKTGG